MITATVTGLLARQTAEAEAAETTAAGMIGALFTLAESGAISAEEYLRKKAELLARI